MSVLGDHRVRGLTLEFCAVIDVGWQALDTDPTTFPVLVGMVMESQRHGHPTSRPHSDNAKHLIASVLASNRYELYRPAFTLLDLHPEAARSRDDRLSDAARRLGAEWEPDGDSGTPSWVIDCMSRVAGFMLQEAAESAQSSRPSYGEVYSLAYAHEFFLSGQHKPYERVTEQIEPSVGIIVSRLEMTLKLPTAQLITSRLSHVINLSDDPSAHVATAASDELRPGSLVLPVAIFRRGSYLGGLHASDISGTDLVVLAREAGQDMTSRVLNLSWQLAVDADSPNATHEALRAALIGIPHQDPSAALQTRKEAVSGMLTSDVRVRSLAELLRLFRRAALISKRYLVWVEVPATPGQRLQVNLRYKIRFVLNRSAEPAPGTDARRLTWLRWARLHSRIQRAVHSFAVKRLPTARPAVPTQLFFDCSLMYRADSYHFQLEAPSGFYVSRQDFLLGGSDVPSKERRAAFDEFATSARASRADYNGPRAAGSPYCHLYAQGLSEPIGRKPVQAAVSFYEIPPGSASTMLTLAVALLFNGLILLVSPLAPQKLVAFGITFDLASLLLATPAALLFLRTIRHGEPRSFLGPPVPVLLTQRVAMGYVVVTLFGALLQLLVRPISGDLTDLPVLRHVSQAQWEHDGTIALYILRLGFSAAMGTATVYLYRSRHQALKSYDHLQRLAADESGLRG